MLTSAEAIGGRSRFLHSSSDATAASELFIGSAEAVEATAMVTMMEASDDSEEFSGNIQIRLL